MRTLSRRRIIAAAGGLAALPLLACEPAAAQKKTPAPAEPTKPTAAAPTAAPAAATKPAAAAPAPAPTAEPKRGGVLKQAATTEAVSFHPFKTTDTASGGYQSYVYSGGMTRYDPVSLEPIPNMAEKWEIGADKLTYTWSLRQDVKWSDGKPLTSEDWLWTFQQAAKPENKYPYKTNAIDPIAEISAPDPYRLVVKLKEPLVVGLEQADPPAPLPKHVWEKYDWNDPAKNPEIMSPSVGSGPFKLKEWRRDDHAEFVANDAYWRGRPLMDGILIRIVPDQRVSYEMLKNGEVDSGVVQPTDFEEAKGNPFLKLYEWDPAIASWDYIGFNLRRPVLQDVRLRRAIAYATRRDAISKVVYNNLAKPTYSNYTPTSWVYNPEVPRYDFDPKKVADELEAAGWKLPPGQKVRQKDGKPLELKLLFGPNTSKTREQTAVIVQQALAEVGVQLSVQGMEWGAFLSAVQKEPFDWDLQVNGWRTTLDPHWMYQIWIEKTIPDLNSGAYVNKRVAELYEQGGREFDREKRKKIYQEVQQIISTELPYVFLVYQTGWTFLNKRVVPNTPGPLGINYLRETWQITDGK
ncbi:MAG TPA: ABC transporter substrate-binding protein [Chloroflexota bacterium]|jgi:peptide/nickel transport system substrate-binding protein|nr:ABC transporter substrate-binding protein [Chloroflexota bacterium]